MCRLRKTLDEKGKNQRKVEASQFRPKRMKNAVARHCALIYCTSLRDDPLKSWKHTQCHISRLPGAIWYASLLVKINHCSFCILQDV